MEEKTYYLYLSDWESAAGISMETNPRFADCEDRAETRNCVIGNLPSPELLLTSEEIDGKYWTPKRYRNKTKLA